MNRIDSRLPDPINDISFKINKRCKQVATPEHLLHQLRAYEEALSKSTGSLPYRHQIQLNALTEALVILRGREEVTQEDIDTIAGLSKWMNYEFKEL